MVGWGKDRVGLGSCLFSCDFHAGDPCRNSPGVIWLKLRRSFEVNSSDVI